MRQFYTSNAYVLNLFVFGGYGQFFRGKPVKVNCSILYEHFISSFLRIFHTQIGFNRKIMVNSILHYSIRISLTLSLLFGSFGFLLDFFGWITTEKDPFTTSIHFGVPKSFLFLLVFFFGIVFGSKFSSQQKFRTKNVQSSGWFNKNNEKFSRNSRRHKLTCSFPKEKCA